MDKLIGRWGGGPLRVNLGTLSKQEDNQIIWQILTNLLLISIQRLSMAMTAKPRMGRQMDYRRQTNEYERTEKEKNGKSNHPGATQQTL